MRICGCKSDISVFLYNYFLLRKELFVMLFSESLKKNDQFRNVYGKGKSYADCNLVLYVWKNGSSINRLGISCSKKVGNSVVRHRFARLVRESYRLHENIFNSGLDIVVVARACARDCSYHDIEKSLLFLAGRAHIIKNGGQTDI